jgi:hypothetical protein
MARTSDSEGTHQTAVRLPKALFERLKESELGVSGELRRRVEWTFDLEPMDNPTRELLMRIACMAHEVELETGTPWHKHAGSFAAFRQAILATLARSKPEGWEPFGPWPSFGERPHQTMPGNDPSEVGMWAEHSVWRGQSWSRETREAVRAEQERTFQEISKIHEQNEREKGEKS